MKLSQFDYQLPKRLIAQKPAIPRDSSKLLVLNREDESIEHKIFYQIDRYLKRGDVIVLNNSKVIPARLLGNKETGGAIEVLLLNKIEDGIWEILVNKKVKVGDKIFFGRDFFGEIIKLPAKSEKWQLKFNCGGDEFNKNLNKFGAMPLPPYIKRNKFDKQVKKQYQTVFASPLKAGSVAAPTAGFHFTKRLIKKLKNNGVKFLYITLHVGLGTFAPVRENNIEKHQMHAEYAEVDQKTLTQLKKAKKEGKRIIAVGTTSTRALESVIITPHHKFFKGWIDLYIYPGYKFKFVDAIITNFHLPKTTLLMLVSAFAGTSLIKKAYRQAIKNNYRFYSFGDAMLII